MRKKTTGKSRAGSGSAATRSRRSGATTPASDSETPAAADTAETPEDTRAEAESDKGQNTLSPPTDVTEGGKGADMPEPAAQAPEVADAAPEDSGQDASSAGVGGSGDDTLSAAVADGAMAAPEPTADESRAAADAGDSDAEPATPGDTNDTPDPAPTDDTAAQDARASSADSITGTTSEGSRDHPADAGAASAAAMGSLAAGAVASDGARTEPEPAPTAAPPSAQARSSSGFVPMLLGGVVAGAIGFGAHYLWSLDQGATDPAAAVSAELAELRAEIAALPDAPEINLAEIEAELAALREALGVVEAVDLASVEAQIATLSTEQEDALDALRETVAASEAEIAALRSEIAGRDSDIEAMHAALAASEAQMDAFRDEMADLRDLASRRIAEAETAVDMAMARAGLDTLQAALTTGAPYPQAVAQMREAGVVVPEALAAPAASGVPTLGMLQEQFPAAARVALRDAYQSAPADSAAERFGNFFRAQVGARSTAPREGDDPDAVLSRAEAALENDDLAAALDELAALSDNARAGMADWLNGAGARQAAEAALPGLIEAITTE